LDFFSKLKSVFGSRTTEPPLISVVLNFRQPMPLSDEALHAAVTRAWGRDVREELNESIVNRPPICFVKVDGIVLMLTNGAKPYCPAEYLEEALAQFPDERQKRVAREHRAFLAIDLMSPRDPAKVMKNECYRRMARLALELVDASCLGIYIPETGHMRPYDDRVVAALRSDYPLRELEKW
jgi:hypothetical protein